MNATIEKPQAPQPVQTTPTVERDLFCCRCKDDFPLAKEPTQWHMGEMRLLSKAPKKIRDQFREWLQHDEGKYLCGNCYFDLFDLTDE